MENIYGGHQRARKKIVFVCGCFDILHYGHIQLLNFAKSLGDILVVGLNSDESVRLLKGKDRPINIQAHRLAMLRELRCVDDVIVFGETTPCNLIEKICPDIFVLGGEYRGRAIPEHRSAERCNCQVVYYDKNTYISTTEIIEKLKGKG